MRKHELYWCFVFSAIVLAMSAAAPAARAVDGTRTASGELTRSNAGRFLSGCGNLATTDCPLWMLVEGERLSHASKGVPEIIKYNFKTGQTRPLSFAQFKRMARRELTSRRYHSVFSRARATADLLAPNGMSKVRLLDAVVSANPAHEAVQTTIKTYLALRRPDHAPRVMLIGDSIRMRQSGEGYGVRVYNDLARDYIFVHIPHNTSSSTVVTQSLAGWLRRPLDLVLINAGLHDLENRKADPNVTLTQYRKNLEKIVHIVRRHHVGKFAFVASTPVRDDIYQQKAGPNGIVYRANADVVAYNKVMADVAAAAGVPVVDLYSPLKACLKECIRAQDGVHLTNLGETRAAQVIERAIDKTLNHS